MIVETEIESEEERSVVYKLLKGVIYSRQASCCRKLRNGRIVESEVGNKLNWSEQVVIRRLMYRGIDDPHRCIDFVVGNPGKRLSGEIETVRYEKGWVNEDEHSVLLRPVQKEDSR